MKKIGFLGLGIMGTAMATNLLKAGYPLTVWNRSPGKSGSFNGQDVQWGKNPAEVVAQSDVTFAMVSDPEASRALCFNQGGVLETMSEGKSYVDISTVDPETAREISSAVIAKGGRFLEAPVSGSKKPAEDGTLVFLCGGDKTLFDEILPALEVMGKKSFYFGDAGTGAKTKLVVNMIMGTMITALSEGLALGQSCELDPAEILAVLAEGAIDNPMFRLKGPQMLKHEYPTAFPLKHMQKDLRLALHMGDANRQPLFAAASANNAFIRAMMMGLGDADTGAVFEAIRRTT